MAKRGRPKVYTGRPPSLTQELIDQILPYIEAGNYCEIACEINGISRDTFYTWLKAARNPKGKPIYKKFRQALKEAEGRAEANSVMRIRKAGQKQWQANAWYLERKARERWGRSAADITGGEGVPSSSFVIQFKTEKKEEPDLDE